MWYEFNSLDEFNTWHDALCEALQYPLASYNQATGELDLGATMTTAYCEAILVEDKCWVGFNVILLKGVTLSEECIVGAGSVVTHSFEKGSVIAGNPATLIKKQI